MDHFDPAARGQPEFVRVQFGVHDGAAHELELAGSGQKQVRGAPEKQRPQGAQRAHRARQHGRQDACQWHAVFYFDEEELENAGVGVEYA